MTLGGEKLRGVMRSGGRSPHQGDQCPYRRGPGQALLLLVWFSATRFAVGNELSLSLSLEGGRRSSLPKVVLFSLGRVKAQDSNNAFLFLHPCSQVPCPFISWKEQRGRGFIMIQQVWVAGSVLLHLGPWWRMNGNHYLRVFFWFRVTSGLSSPSSPDVKVTG